MKKRFACLAAALLLAVLSGCAADVAPETTAPSTAPVETVPAATVPADGNPGDVTCKGTYAGTGDDDAVVAKVGDAKLTNAQLRVWYQSAVAQWRSREDVPMPDFTQSLDTQVCEADDSVGSWQQFFLRQALEDWHRAQAMAVKGQEEGLPVEEVFQPKAEQRAEYLNENLPALKYLYRESDGYQLNSMHQSYIEGLPALFDETAQGEGYANGEDLAEKAFGTTEDALLAAAGVYNEAYMFFSDLSTYVEVNEDEAESWFLEHEHDYAAEGITWDAGRYVDVRHILVVPNESDYEDGGLTAQVDDSGVVTCDEALWDAAYERAEDILNQWKRHKRPGRESTFADIAYHNSEDGAAPDGGAYHRIRQGQFAQEVDQWCFDESRKTKDTVILRSPYGWHILYFVESNDIWYVEAKEDLTAHRQKALLEQAMEDYPMDVDYEKILLTEGEGSVSLETFLYPDVAHERYPEIPLYLQQDYGETKYGAYRLRTHGCGITSLAMLGSYMTDVEWTPPELCKIYGYYNTEHGTDVTLFIYEPPAMGFYLKKVSYKADEAKQALEEGYPVISLQKEGYWTRGGHYIVLEKMNEDGTIQVRDSNLFNYAKLEAHMQDAHTWESITGADKVYWIFEKKTTHIPACTRCGDGEGLGGLLNEGYLCEKCTASSLRREVYRAAMLGE